MDFSNLIRPLAGGLLIGFAAAALLLLRGRMAGISGILAGVLFPVAKDTEWRVLFLTGLVAAGLIAFACQPSAFANTLSRSVPALAIAGLLVGIGARVGGGCTSGHGVCGVSRLSMRSIIATAAFVLSGAVTVFLVNRLAGGVL